MWLLGLSERRPLGVSSSRVQKSRTRLRWRLLGGLGTASYGLTKGMYNNGDMEISFVIPKPQGMPNTVGLTLPRERSKSVACTWITSGLPVTFFACMPAG